MSDVESKQYKIYLTPRTNENTYGTEIEISAEILNNGVKTMKKTIDSGDFDVGVYVFGDISLKVINNNGYFSEESDLRSVFSYSRDLAKIRVTYVDNTGESTRFKGLINEDATKEDFTKEEITFKVLSLDSVFRTTRVAGGLVTNGVSASDALGVILNQSKITNVLNFSAANVNPDNDITVDDGSHFDNKTVKTAVNELLLATNSVLIIDSSDNIIVKAREPDVLDNAFNLYGPYDIAMRQNIISLRKFNRGYHRVFTSCVVEGTAYTDVPFSLDYGFRQKTVSLGFITADSTKTSIATSLTEEFKNPKTEFEVECETSTVKDLDLLKLISVNYPLRIKRYDDSFLPIVGDTKIGDSDAPLPYLFGNNFITPDMAFKIIEISENPSRFTTVLKLRQTNTGYFSSSASSFVGFAIIGESVIAGAGEVSYNPALIGGAVVGSTKTA